MSWYKIDDLQWCESIGERKYKIIKAFWIDTCPTDTENDYCVCSGLVDLNDYNDEEIKDIISSYYGSVDETLENFHASKENLHKLDEIVAERIFEEKCFTDGHSHGTFSKDKAIEYIANWISDTSNKIRIDDDTCECPTCGRRWSNFLGGMLELEFDEGECVPCCPVCGQLIEDGDDDDDND